MAQKVIAQRGDSTYLLDIGDEKGRILNMEEKVLYAPLFLPSILARGYWEPVEVAPGDLTKMLEGVEDRQERP